MKPFRYANEISEYAKILDTRLKAKAAILAGSTAGHEDMPWSDVDIVVIGDFSENFLERIRKLDELNTTKTPIEPVGYTHREFIRMLKSLNPKALEAVEYGAPIIDRGVIEEYRTILDELKRKGLIRTKCSYAMTSGEHQ